MLVGLRPFASSSSETVVTPPTPTGPVDPYYSSVYGLYHLDTDYNDSGPAGRPLMTSSTTSTFGLQSSVSKFGTGALQCSVNMTTVVKVPPHASLYATGDFCVEFWMRANGTQTTYSNILATMGAAGLSSTAAPVDGLGFCNWTNHTGSQTGATTATCYLNNPPNQARLTTIRNPNDGAWHHLALTRSGSTCYLYFDGVMESSAPYSLPLDLGKTHGLIIGRGTNVANNNTFNGFLDDIRITIGVPRYTSNFSVPTAEHPNNG